MKSIEIIKKNINVSRVVKQLKKNPQDWDHQKKIKDSKNGYIFLSAWTFYAEC